MAFAITNKNFATPDAAWIPSCHFETEITMVSSTIAAATQNTGIVGLKWIRVRANLKTLGGIAAGETFVISVQAGTGAAVTAPEQIAFRSVTMQTGDLTITQDVIGWSQNGFQSYIVTCASSGSARTGVVDVMVDCA